MYELKPVLSEQLDALDRIKHGFFTRPGGVSEGIYKGLNAGLGSDDERELVVENRRRMAKYLGVSDASLASPYQVHSPTVIVTDKAWHEDRPKADGVVTSTPGLALGIVTADCGPVLFAEPEGGVIGACHAGWKGALTGVLEATIDAMEAQGATRSKITAILGPTISQVNYEVGPDIPTAFTKADDRNSRFFIPSLKEGHHMFDLTGYIVNRLLDSGVMASAVNRCTYDEEDNFFSYRRTTHRGEGDYGRQLSAILLRQ